MTNKEICKINPIRGEVYENGIRWSLPCGVKFVETKQRKEEVHCKKYADRTCEYMALEHVKRQQREAETLADEIIKDFYGGC